MLFLDSARKNSLFEGIEGLGILEFLEVSELELFFFQKRNLLQGSEAFLLVIFLMVLEKGGLFLEN